jgi:hypothetical protein
MSNKYGLFFGAGEKPMQTFEGDTMRQNGDHVYIYTGNKQVAGVKLGEGQCVKIISDDAQPRTQQHQSLEHIRPGVWS